MLNSIHLANSHYTLKLKSMFDLAIATHRYAQQPHNQQQQHVYPIQASYSLSPSVPAHQQIPELAERKQLIPSQTQIGGTSFGVMDDCSGGGGGGPQESRELAHLTYPTSPHSDSSHKSPESISPPASCTPEGSCNTSTISVSGHRDMLSSDVYSNSIAQQQSPFLISSARNPVTENVDKLSCGSSTKHGAKAKGPVGGKPSFSIESLLANPNSWRRHPSQNDSKPGKDGRFLPYSVAQQSPQSRAPRHPSDGKNVVNTGSEERRSENYAGGGGGGGTKVGNSRRAAKSKRVRTIFTPEQLERLEAEFERQQYMVGPERLYLASSLYLTEAQVKVWFQNRRIKWRKQHLEMEQQRLAIYRTLAEQDMMTTVDPEDSIDSDYDDDEGGTDDERSSAVHSPQQSMGSRASVTAQSYSSSLVPPEKIPVEPPSLQMQQHLQAISANKVGKSSTGSMLSNTDADHHHQHHHQHPRLPLQQASNNEEYELSASAMTSSSASSTAPFVGAGVNARNQDRHHEMISPSGYSHRNSLVAAKK